MKNLCFALAIAAFASPLLAARPSTDRAPALPDPAKVEQRLARDIEWFRRNSMPTCKDAAAAEALAAMVQTWSDDPKRPGNEQERAWKASERAVKAGCDDALLLYTHARLYNIAALESTERGAELAREAAAALNRSRHHPAFKLLGNVRAAEAIAIHARASRSMSAAGVQEHLDAARDFWPEIAKDKELPDTLAVDLLQWYLDARRELRGDRKEDFAPILAAFEAHRAGSAIVPLLRARFALDYAWDARGGAFAGKVTENAMNVFATRLADAEREVAKAMAIDPASPALAPLMLVVELGQGRGRERLESWFRFGVAANPGDTALWTAKMHYLEPRWHGSDEEMLAFGREALATKSWALQIPMLLLTAHHHLAQQTGDVAAYFADPDVCREVRGVYDGFLAKYPDSPYERSAYALALYRCGDLPAAHKQFQKIGNDRRITPFGTRAFFDKVRTEAALNH
ncbi:MAG TPA: hypothetical protein VF698_01155 [Thermoanaerobaculia bacterium]|jgi:hypothetical protein